MPDFAPFRAIRYDTDRVDLADVTAPPYDVIDDDHRARLAARHPNNVVRIDLPADEDGLDRYAVARHLLEDWQREGVLVRDDEPALYVHTMGYRDDQGRPRQTTGVLGALELRSPGDGILPHEHTTPKAKSDRLDMLRSCRANLSAVWGLSPVDGLSELLRIDDPPIAAWTDEDGVHHRFWRLERPGVVATIREAVASEPVVIADGHHRYETSLQYRDELGEPGPADHVLVYLVELAAEQLTVQPIHRLLSGLPDDLDLPAALGEFFDLFDAGPPGETLAARMEDAGALALVTPDGAWLARPRAEAMQGVRDLDSSRLDRAREELPAHEVTFQHGTANALEAVRDGRAQAAVLLRPATVDQITDIAHGGERMPPKTTFFSPKPPTGLVLRSLE